MARACGCSTLLRFLLRTRPPNSRPILKPHLKRLSVCQLFQNLVGNAVKYHRAGVPPRIHVSVQRDRHFYVFSVCDNGIGIEKEYQEGRPMHDDRPPAHRAQMGKALADAVPDGREPKTDVYDSGSVFKRGTRPLFAFGRCCRTTPRGGNVPEARQACGSACPRFWHTGQHHNF